MPITMQQYIDAIKRADFQKKLKLMSEWNPGMDDDDNLWSAVREAKPTDTIGDIVDQCIINGFPADEEPEEGEEDMRIQLLKGLGVPNLELFVMQGTKEN